MLRKKPLGSTGIDASAIGLGTVKFGRNQQVHYPAAFHLPSDADIVALLAVARDLGINLLDTAPAYGNSEIRLGQLLGKERSQWVLSTKVGEEFINGASVYDFSPAATIASVERSLVRLNTDYLDIVLVHSNGNDTQIIEETEIFNTLANLKSSGKIRAFGMSTKTVAGGLLAVKHADAVMVMHNPAYTTELPVIEFAQQQGKAVFIKKALASGHLDKLAAHNADPVQKALQFVLQEPGVSSVIIGTLSPAHLTHNVNCAQTALTLLGA